MWEVALGNTFGATALASYGGFLDFHWYQCVPIQVNSVKPAIDFETVNTPGGFDIAKAYGGETPDFYNAFGLYIFGWFIFTFILWLVTIRSTVAFSSLFASVWLSFLCLAIGYIDAQNQPDKMPNVPLTRAGGAFGIIAGFLAWYVLVGVGLLRSGLLIYVVGTMRLLVLRNQATASSWFLCFTSRGARKRERSAGPLRRNKTATWLDRKRPVL